MAQDTRQKYTQFSRQWCQVPRRVGNPQGLVHSLKTVLGRHLGCKAYIKIQDLTPIPQSRNSNPISQPSASSQEPGACSAVVWAFDGVWVGSMVIMILALDPKPTLNPKPETLKPYPKPLNP